MKLTITSDYRTKFTTLMQNIQLYLKQLLASNTGHIGGGYKKIMNKIQTEKNQKGGRKYSSFNPIAILPFFFLVDLDLVYKEIIVRAINKCIETCSKYQSVPQILLTFNGHVAEPITNDYSYLNVRMFNNFTCYSFVLSNGWLLKVRSMAYLDGRPEFNNQYIVLYFITIENPENPIIIFSYIIRHHVNFGKM